MVNYVAGDYLRRRFDYLRRRFSVKTGWVPEKVIAETDVSAGKSRPIPEDLDRTLRFSSELLIFGYLKDGWTIPIFLR